MNTSHTRSAPRRTERFAWGAVIIGLALAAPVAGEPEKMTRSEKVAATDWAGIRGVNYIPSYGRNMYENWRDYDAEAFDVELGLARKVGYTSVRLWLNYFVFAEQGSQAIDNVEDAVRLCRKHGLKALITLFDGCGIRPRPDARQMTVKEAYDHFLASPDLSPQQKQMVKFNYEKYAHGPGREVPVWVGKETPPHIILWQHWQPSPGYDKLGEEYWPRFDPYVRALVGRLADNDAVLGWDLMNEPEIGSEYPITNGFDVPEVQTRLMNFIRHVQGVIRKDFPREVLTIGFARLESSMQYEELVDVLSFHTYRPDLMRREIEQAHAFSQKIGKPILITETLANFQFMPYDIEYLATDQGQLERYQTVLPILMDSPIGWMAWGLVVGRIFDSYTDIFYANGQRRPAADYLERTLKGETGSN